MCVDGFYMPQDEAQLRVVKAVMNPDVPRKVSEIIDQACNRNIHT
jgi:hypothetical protein